MCPTAWRPFPPSDISRHNLSRRKPWVKAGSPLIAFLPSLSAINHDTAFLRYLAIGEKAQKLAV
jgi:hypothetical protein